MRCTVLLACLAASGAGSSSFAQAPAGAPVAPIAVVKDLYTSFERGDIQHIDALLTPDTVWTFHAPPHVVPYAGTYKGKDGVRQFFARIASTIDVHEIGQRQFMQEKDTVAVVGWERSVARETGGEFYAEWLHLFTIKAGQIARFEEFTDSAAITAALAPADTERGRAYYTTCAGCHGTAAQGNSGMRAPNLTPLDDAYLLRQLRHFAHDIRGGVQDFYGWQMNGRAKALVAYIETLPKTVSYATLQGDAIHGKALYASCVGCHGSEGRGNAAVGAPALAGLDDWYLAEQLESFANGTRGTHKEDSSGAQMRAAAAGLQSQDVRRDVVAYIATLKGSGQ